MICGNFQPSNYLAPANVHFWECFLIKAIYNQTRPEFDKNTKKTRFLAICAIFAKTARRIFFANGVCMIKVSFPTIRRWWSEIDRRKIS